MKRWNSAVWLVVLSAAAGCSPAPARATLPSAPGRIGRSVMVQVAEERGRTRRVPLEQYVQATVISEFAPASEDPEVVARMLEVQSILARTYAVASAGRHAKQGFDLCSSTHCQLFEPSRLKTSRWAPAARAAAARTAGALLWHGGGPVLALFHADCGGHTNTAVNAWRGTSRPYLTAMPDDDAGPEAHRTWHYEAPAATLLLALNSDRRTRVGTRIDSISIVSRDASGRAETVALNGQIDRLVHGEDLRSVLTRHLGPGTVKSALFEVRRDRGSFAFDGRGFGHGVGLCQSGALARLRAGATPAAVLQRYFPHTELRGLGH